MKNSGVRQTCQTRVSAGAGFPFVKAGLVGSDWRFGFIAASIIPGDYSLGVGRLRAFRQWFRTGCGFRSDVAAFPALQRLRLVQHLHWRFNGIQFESAWAPFQSTTWLGSARSTNRTLESEATVFASGFGDLVVKQWLVERLR